MIAMACAFRKRPMTLAARPSSRRRCCVLPSTSWCDHSPNRIGTLLHSGLAFTVTFQANDHSSCLSDGVLLESQIGINIFPLLRKERKASAQGRFTVVRALANDSSIRTWHRPPNLRWHLLIPVCGVHVGMGWATRAKGRRGGT